MTYLAYANLKKINLLLFLGLALIFSRALAEEEKSLDWQRQGYFLTRFYQDAKEETSQIQYYSCVDIRKRDEAVRSSCGQDENRQRAAGVHQVSDAVHYRETPRKDG